MGNGFTHPATGYLHTAPGGARLVAVRIPLLSEERALQQPHSSREYLVRSAALQRSVTPLLLSSIVWYWTVGRETTGNLSGSVTLLPEDLGFDCLSPANLLLWFLILGSGNSLSVQVLTGLLSNQPECFFFSLCFHRPGAGDFEVFHAAHTSSLQAHLLCFTITRP
jgi:hypothetical protein